MFCLLQHMASLELSPVDAEGAAQSQSPQPGSSIVANPQVLSDPNFQTSQAEAVHPRTPLMSAANDSNSLAGLFVRPPQQQQQSQPASAAPAGTAISEQREGPHVIVDVTVPSPVQTMSGMNGDPNVNMPSLALPMAYTSHIPTTVIPPSPSVHGSERKSSMKITPSLGLLRRVSGSALRAESVAY